MRFQNQTQRTQDHESPRNNYNIRIKKEKENYNSKEEDLPEEEFIIVDSQGYRLQGPKDIMKEKEIS